ncbi:transposase domain containing protein [Nephila pilipes]|uniref:Transposase domain containing protein n=1 Tax=Nephila pilipes TaxID=299642 RepID=A0A8X6R1K4_NEPPI|nr:transposase domain containing protein [Nephila pilipes]
MGRQLRVQRPPIHNISDLRDHCLNIWYNLSPVIYQGLVASMPRRVEAALRAKVNQVTGSLCNEIHTVQYYNSNDEKPLPHLPPHFRKRDTTAMSPQNLLSLPATENKNLVRRVFSKNWSISIDPLEDAV